VDNSLVSILIPCYNAEKYVAAAIESALGQTWPNLEVIVVDDGSSDGSLRIAQHFTSKGVQVVSQSNRGASAARNHALAASRGTYIKFLDADDLVHPQLIERQLARMGDSETAVASAEWGRFYRDDPSTFQLSSESVWRDMPSLDWLVEAWMNAQPMMQAALFLVPRRLLDRCGGWNERLTLIDDFEFFSRVLCYADEVRFASGAPVYYRSGIQGSLSGRMSQSAVESAYLSLTEGTAHLLKLRCDLPARKACANLLQDFVYAYYPRNRHLIPEVDQRIYELGGSSLIPTGTKPFERLRDIFGWRIAKRIQRAAYRVGYKPRQRHRFGISGDMDTTLV
jgi:glycosyltransferase involved in cell wall biosynthesis